MKDNMLMNKVNNIILLVVAIACAIFYLGITSAFELSSIIKTSLVVYLVIIYLIIVIILRRFQRNMRMARKIRTVEKIVPQTIIREVEKPVIHEVIKEVLVQAPQHRELKHKYYGSTEAKTYHLRKCRFSGMIKQQYLIEKNSNSYFKKNKFHACKNCMPNKR